MALTFPDSKVIQVTKHSYHKDSFDSHLDIPSLVIKVRSTVSFYTEFSEKGVNVSHTMRKGINGFAEKRSPWHLLMISEEQQLPFCVLWSLHLEIILDSFQTAQQVFSDVIFEKRNKAQSGDHFCANSFLLKRHTTCSHVKIRYTQTVNNIFDTH